MAITINTFVDPFRINRAPWALDSQLDYFREISGNTRLGKAALANYYNWTAITVGSSRLEMGIDPKHTAFDNYDSVNLAMQAAVLSEVIPVSYYTINQNPDLKRLILGIEMGDISVGEDLRAITNFYQSPFYENYQSIESTFDSLLGWRAVKESFNTLARYFASETPDRNHLGYWCQPKDPPNIRRHTERILKLKKNLYPKGKWDLVMLEEQPRTLIESFKELLIKIRERKIQLYVLIPPQHALRLIHPYNPKPEQVAWEDEIQRLINICREVNALPFDGPKIELWTFQTFNEFNVEALPDPQDKDQRLEYWYDLGHMRPSVGNKMVATIFNKSQISTKIAQLFGVELLSTEWELFKRSWIEKHENYYRSNATDIDWYMHANSHSNSRSDND